MATRVRRRGRRGSRRRMVSRRSAGVRITRRRRRRGARRNPLWRSRRSGRYKGRAPGRRLHKIRGGTGWHNPRRRRGGRRRRRFLGIFSNPPARRRRRRSGGRRRHSRRYASNPGRRRVSLMSNPVDALMGVLKDAFSMESFETLFQTGLGFAGTLAGARLVYKSLITGMDTPVGRVGAHLGVTVIETLLGTYVGGTKLASRAMVGGLLATLWQGLTEVLPAKAKEFIPTLGDAETDEFRKAIEREVVRELRGRNGGNENGMSVYLQPAGVSDTYLSPAGASAYLTSGEGERAVDRAGGMGTYLTEREIERTEAGMGNGEFSARGMSERF